MFVISMWYIRQEQAIRAGAFFSAATVAGAFGGILAYGVAHMVMCLLFSSFFFLLRLQWYVVIDMQIFISFVNRMRIQDGLSGLRGWQWIFIIEGLPTIILCIVAFFVLPDFPATATFLTSAERGLTMKRLQADAGPANETEFTWDQFWAAFKDWKVYLHMLIGFFHAVPHAALGLSIPSIVEGFNFE